MPSLGEAYSYNRFVMSVDVDGWSSLLRFYSVDHDPLEADRQVSEEDGLDRLLSVFERQGVKATFFVPRDIISLHPGKFREIAGLGHEVACHGLRHDKNECLRGRESQRRGIEQATETIRDIVGKVPVGFRAPCLRANKLTLGVLREIGYLYDSSFMPMFIPGTYGSLSFRLRPYYVSSEGEGGLLEIPVSTNPLLPIPLSASWMRNLGLAWVKFGVRMLFNIRCPIMFYVHPRDVLDLPGVAGVPWHLYRNTGDACMSMLDELLQFVRDLGGQFVRGVDLALMIRGQDRRTLEVSG